MINFKESINFIKNLSASITADTVISLIALLLSLYNFFKSFWDNRSCLSLCYKSCCSSKIGNRNILYFEFAFENKSRIPISITRMFLYLDKTKYEFSWIPERVITDTYLINHNPVDIKTIYSEKIPHTIDPLGAWGGFFFLEPALLPSHEQLINCKSKIVLHTNRGKKTKYFKISTDTVNLKNA